MSSNEATSSRSMNGIIDVFAGSIRCDTIDANIINVDDLTINDTLTVNNVQLTPEEVAQLSGINTNETIQTQIDNIVTDINDYVTLDTTQQISGEKEFLNTTTLSGDLDVSGISITPTELSYSSGLIGNIQDQIDNAVVGMTLDTNQTASGFKIFANGINTPFIQNSDQSGFINGFLLDLETILFSSYNGVWDNGVSIVSGGNVTNKILVDLDPNIAPYNEATIEANDELQPIKKTTKGYIPTTDTFLLKDVTNIQVLNGIVFDTSYDIIDTLVGNQITLQYNTGISQTPISINGTIIQIATDYYLITSDIINVFDFIECANTTPLTETILNPAPNQYLLSYTGTAPTETTNVTINNFNYNNKLFTDSIATDYTGKYAVDNLNIPYGSKLTVSSNNSVYNFSLNPSNQISIDDVYGFYDNGLFIFETTNLVNPSTKSLLLQNTEEHGFITSVSANNEIVLSFNNFQTTTLSATNHSYVKNLTGTPFMIIDANRTDYYSNNSSISFIGSNLGGFSYGITSPNTIVADTPNTISVNYYLPNSTTIIFLQSTPFVVGDFYEIGANYGYRISSVQLINGVSGYRYGTSSNSSAVNTSSSLVGVVVENYTGSSLDGTYSFLYSNFLPPPKLNAPIFNVTYASQNSVSYISTNTRTNQTNSFGFTRTFGTFVPSPKRENKSFRYMVDAQGNYIFDADTKTIQLNDIVQYIGTGLGFNDNNNQRTGYYINSIKTVGVNNTALYQYGGLYSESATSSYKFFTGTSDNLVYFGLNTPAFSVATSRFTGTQPAVGDFIYFDLFNDGNYSYTYITSISIQSNFYLMYVNFDYNANLYGRTAYFYKPERQSFGFVTIPKLYNIFGRITYDQYTFNTSIDKYAQTNKFYPPQTYNLFQNTTTKIYDEIAINEFPAIDFNIYQNYQYNFQTTKNISLPAVGQNDTFVTRRFQQTLTNKKIGDDLIVDGRITLTGENDPSTLLCKISPFGFGGGDIVAENNITGGGLLDMSDNSLEHKIGDVYIGRQYTNTSTNYGLSVGSSITDVNNFIVSRNEDNNVTAFNSKGQLDLRLNNANIFSVLTNGATRLNQASGSVVETFCDANNCYMDFQTSATNDYAVRLAVKKSSNTIGTGYLNIIGNTILQKGYLAINFRDGTSLPNGVIRNVEWTSNTLPTGFTKNDIGGGYSTTLTNNSGYDRTLVMGGNLSINTGSSGFLLIWLGQGSTRLFTFQAPIENGSISVTISFTFQITNGQTVFFQAYQNSGGTRTIANNGVRRSRVYGQVL